MCTTKLTALAWLVKENWGKSDHGDMTFKLRVLHTGDDEWCIGGGSSSSGSSRSSSGSGSS